MQLDAVFAQDYSKPWVLSTNISLHVVVPMIACKCTYIFTRIRGIVILTYLLLHIVHSVIDSIIACIVHKSLKTCCLDTPEQNLALYPYLVK